MLGRGTRIGNFVETKKATLGDYSKANHLAYLGDATLGERVNVGAGTITCNYDGIGKHPTVLGDDVFVGSNSTLVAPLTVGDGTSWGLGPPLPRTLMPKPSPWAGAGNAALRVGSRPRPVPSRSRMRTRLCAAS